MEEEVTPVTITEEGGADGARETHPHMIKQHLKSYILSVPTCFCSGLQESVPVSGTTISQENNSDRVLCSLLQTLDIVAPSIRGAVDRDCVRDCETVCIFSVSVGDIVS